jgi:hypothetical protein
MRTLYHLMIAASMLILPACSLSPSDATWKKMLLVQSKPTYAEVSDGDNVREIGEGLAFEAALRNEGGKVVGQLLGENTIIDLPGEDGVGNANSEERFTRLSFVLEDGDEIIVQGANVYPVAKREIKADAPQFRAVTGGTGRYKGIRGQVKTTRSPNGTFTHLLEYRLD